MFPTCLNLNEKQKQIAKGFVLSHAAAIAEANEEDCCGTSAFTFEVVTSGIGDSVYIRFGKERAWLDDGLEA